MSLCMTVYLFSLIFEARLTLTYTCIAFKYRMSFCISLCLFPSVLPHWHRLWYWSVFSLVHGGEGQCAVFRATKAWLPSPAFAAEWGRCSASSLSCLHLQLLHGLTQRPTASAALQPSAQRCLPQVQCTHTHTLCGFTQPHNTWFYSFPLECISSFTGPVWTMITDHQL